MKSWSPVQFQLKPGNSSAEFQSYHYATETQLIQVEPQIATGGSQTRFFKLLIQ
jgi:hypothetical protein